MNSGLSTKSDAVPGVPIAHGGAIGAAAARFGGKIEDWLDLSTGINPCPPALPIIDERAWHRLPDRSLSDAAVEAARSYYGSGPIDPLPVPGTQAAIQLLPRLVAPGRRVGIVWPTYGEYERVFRAAGFAVDRLASPDLADGSHGLVVVVNPNNPTGTLSAANDLEALAMRLAPTGGLLVVDEAFADGGGSGAGAESLVPHVSRHSNLIVFRSFGKFFGMAGIRLGFVVTDPARSARMAEWLGPWAVSGPALQISAALMSGDTGAIARRIRERRKGLADVLASSGLVEHGGTSLFALVALAGEERGGEGPAVHLRDHLCRHQILTRAFDYAPDWLRIGLAPDADGDERLRAALSSRPGG